MLIIIEGVDGSGKSTLAKKLEKDLGYKVLPVIPLKPGHELVWDFFINSDDIYISDRSFITDLVYRSFDNKGRNFKPENINRWLMSKKLLIIHCDTDTSFEDSIKRGEDNITKKEHHHNIKEMYKYYLLHVNEYLETVVIKYDWKTDKYKELLKLVKDFPQSLYPSLLSESEFDRFFKGIWRQ